LAGSKLFKCCRRSTFELAADGFRCCNKVRTTPGAEQKTSDHATPDLGRQPEPHALIFKVADSAIPYITAVLRVSEVCANSAIVGIRVQATRSGAKSRNFLTALR
jgi:hypothetical protein